MTRMSDEARYGPVIEPHEDVKIAAVDMLEYKHPAEEIVANHLFELRAVTPAMKTREVKSYGAACDQSFRAVKNSGRRPLSVIELHVIHCTQSDPGSAPGVARYFTSSSAGGSTQYVMDDFDCYRTLPDFVIPWGAPGANYNGLHYEQCGWAHWTQFIWSSSHRRTMLRTAWKVARDCKRYGNPVVWLDDKKLRRGAKGITDHATCSRVFGGTHTDPGSGYPRKLFMTMVRASYAVIHVLKIA